MPFRSTGSSRPSASASFADFCSDEAIGSFGERRGSSNDVVDELGRERLAGDRLDAASATRFSASSGLSAM